MKDFVVFVAEKPSLGRAIAVVLAKKSPKTDSGREYICGSDWAVCWAAGHIFELVEPDYYLGVKHPGAAKSKTSGKMLWSMDHLPFIPGEQCPDWSIQLCRDRASLFKTIKGWVAKASVVVNAGDPDREGQLLIDEILAEIGVSVPVKRVLISAIDEVGVGKALANLRSNDDFKGLRNAALGRSRADWLCGMNFSRAATLRAREEGYSGGVVSIGRVQTPLLGLVVQRDIEIEKFKPIDFYGLIAQIQAQGGAFPARWVPSEGQPGLDSEGRLIDRAVATALQAKVQGKPGVVADYSDEDKSEGPWLPFSLDKLQVLASKKYGYTPSDTLKAVQSLYETHKLCTYPRSDCQFLPLDQLADASAVLSAVMSSQSYGSNVSSLVDAKLKSRAWNDKKVTAHHAIIPTTQRANLSALSESERNIYAEICARYTAQFMPPRRYRAVSVLVNVESEMFRASGSTTTFVGWRAIYGSVAEVEEGEEAGVDLPPLKNGDKILCKGLNIEAKKTTPPKHWTESSLLEAMVNIHKYVTEPQIKAIFEKMMADKKSDGEEAACGIGTPATRDTFVPKLIDIGMICKEKPKKGKEDLIKSTPAGRALFLALPSEIAKPDMTALWESALKRIEEGSITLDDFLGNQTKFVTRTVERLKSGPLKLPTPPVAASKTGGGGKSSAGGKSKAPAKPSGKVCPDCGKPMVIRKGKFGDFLGCTGYPDCKHMGKV